MEEAQEWNQEVEKEATEDREQEKTAAYAGHEVELLGKTREEAVKELGAPCRHVSALCIRELLPAGAVTCVVPESLDGTAFPGCSYKVLFAGLLLLCWLKNVLGIRDTYIRCLSNAAESIM